MANINSMTGFGRIETSLPDGQLQWEIRSVNHRYLDIQLKLPEGLRIIEQDLRQLIAASIRRGKVDAILSFSRDPNQPPVTQINPVRSRQVIEHLGILAKQMENPAPISPVAILKWPGVLEEEKIDPQSIFPAATEALKSAITSLSESRAREGAKTQEMLEQRCSDIESLVAAVRERLPLVLTEIRKRLDLRIEALNAQVDGDRMEQEIAILAQKMDVSEELDRLLAHVKEVRTAFKSQEPVGRRLDFLMQELNREANTLGSKSADAETTRQSVDLKVLIEQMREQVQNVE